MKISSWNTQERMSKASRTVIVSPLSKGQVLESTIVSDGDAHTPAQLLIEIQHLHSTQKLHL